MERSRELSGMLQPSVAYPPSPCAAGMISGATAETIPSPWWTAATARYRPVAVLPSANSWPIGTVSAPSASAMGAYPPPGCSLSRPGRRGATPSPAMRTGRAGRASPPAGACATCSGLPPRPWRRWRSSRASARQRPNWPRYWPPARDSGWAVISCLTTCGWTSRSYPAATRGSPCSLGCWSTLRASV